MANFNSKNRNMKNVNKGPRPPRKGGLFDFSDPDSGLHVPDSEDDSPEHDENAVICQHCVTHCAKAPDHFCASKTTSTSEKCTECVRKAVGNRNGGCQPLDIESLGVREEYDAWHAARAAWRRNRTNANLKAFNKAAKVLKQAIRKARTAARLAGGEEESES
ncbi:hypothetical protein F4810DRAFT_708971 [Camillea tinctor]|nr:hypothetical protein F4810DRAFT_708971 [Camillea tinctor]